MLKKSVILMSAIAVLGAGLFAGKLEECQSDYDKDVSEAYEIFAKEQHKIPGYVEQKKKVFNQCVINFNRDKKAADDYKAELQKKEDALYKGSETNSKKQYFELNKKMVKSKSKDEFGNQTVQSSCAIVDEYKKRHQGGNDEIIKIYSQIFQKGLIEKWDWKTSEWWMIRIGSVKGATPALISRGVLPSSIEINNANLQTENKSLKLNSDIYSIIGLVNMYLNDYGNVNKETTKSRLMLFYSFLIAENSADLPVDNRITESCLLTFNMFTDPAFQFILALAKKNASAFKLLDILASKEHGKTTEYLLQNSQTKDIYEKMKGYKW